MMQMDELIAFLTRCLDEDEETYRNLDSTALNGIESTAGWDVRAYVERTLAEVKAKRAIIEAEQDRVLEEGPLPERMRDLIETDVLRLLAQPYAGQDGWREEWQLSAPP
jgi:hypothetical protein